MARAFPVLVFLTLTASCCASARLDLFSGGEQRQTVALPWLSSLLGRASQEARQLEAAAEKNVLSWSLPKNKEYGTQAPLIGILTQGCHNCPGKSYVAAAYVKWIESAGGRAVPIKFYDSDAELKRIFKAVNGLILPGGLTDLYLDDPYVIAGRKLYDWARESNDAGEVFPIWGTCLGHQLLQILASNVSFTELLIETDAVSQPSTLQLTESAPSSYMLGTLRDDLVPKLADESLNLVIQNHEFGLPTNHYEKYPALKQMYHVLSTSKDRNGTEYVSTIEGINYPFFGTQWHPEKPPYEFSLKVIPHTKDAIRVSQHLANVFVEAARHSTHKPESEEEELALLIYNWKPVFTARDIVMEPSYDGPDNTYFFDKVPDIKPTLLTKFN